MADFRTESNQDMKMNHIRKTMIYSLLEEISQKIARYAAHMGGSKRIEITFIKDMKFGELMGVFVCQSGTKLRSSLYRDSSDVILRTKPTIKNTRASKIRANLKLLLFISD